MTFISWAQNGEDVLLYRALKHVQHGFYIDVGAQDPREDSVTRAFYERGWHGINIEPVEHWHRLLEEDRPHDINLRVAVSDEASELRLFEVEGTGLSTSDEDYAAHYRFQGLVVHEHRAPCVTLAQICNEQHVELVHFLKVDCEGAEAAALRGMPLEHIRPWVILVEASEPNSNVPNYQQWEPGLTSRGYQFIYADGINRYYLADEHPELREAFNLPVNVLDDYMVAEEARAHRRVRELDAELTETRSLERTARAEADRDEFQRQAEHWREQGSRLEADLSARLLELSRLQAEVAVLGNERGALTIEVVRLQGEMRAQSNEIARLRQEYRDNSAEHARVQAAFEQIRGSHSWRLTVPLRIARRCIGAVRRGMLRGTKAVLRRPARALHPTLRRLAFQPRAHRMALVVLGGRDSWLARRVRVFLFEPTPTVAPHHIARIGSELDSSVYSRRERVALSALQDAMPSPSTDTKE
ncbi:MAG: FkbM family methyltransferase [Rhodanobacteraceae bacterium]